jgi:P4 family phage/plasmid primase-like protien
MKAPKDKTAGMGSPASITRHLVSLLGDNVVLLWASKGEKGPRWPRWQNTGIDMMRDPRYLKNLDNDRNIAVLTGAPSGGLCSIDIDDDEAIEPFLALNSKLVGTLRSRGRRGCNLWVRVEGAFPTPSYIKHADGRVWGEWRSTGVCSMIHGIHPEGMNYQRCPEVAPITISFEEIQWPDDLTLPWLTADEELPGAGDESDDPIIQQYGVPVFYAKARDGELFVKGINEAYWAALYAAEHTVLHEPDERTFFQYADETGMYSVISPDVIKQAISHRMLEMSRASNELSPLENMRTDKTLNSVVAQLRGITEHRNAFTDRPRAVHLANCMLHFEGSTCLKEGFSPHFRSRNRSPIAFDPSAECPRFLNELLLPAVHADDVVLLQKLAGQCLLGNNLLQRFVILDGTPGGGKSQYANVIQAVVGQENVTQLRTEHLGERFELFRFLRRTMLVGVDVNADFLQSKGAPVIKGLCGGDWLDAEQKGGTGSFQFQGKFNILMTSNARLKINLQGDVGAWRRRMLIVRYEAPPPKRIIHEFADLLIREEGPGILNWALKGLGMLLQDIEETGTIRLTERQRGVVDSLLAESDSLRWFLNANVKRENGSDLTVAEIMEAYAQFCPEKGWSPLPESQIAYQLPSLMLELFQVVKTNNSKRDGKAARGFRGVAFINPEVLP